MAFEVSKWEQCTILFHALLFGLLCGVLCDFFRIVRILLFGSADGTVAVESAGDRERSARARVVRCLFDIFVFCEDVVRFIVVGLLFSVFLYAVNFGELRLYISLGAAVGFFIYYNTLGRLNAAITGALVRISRRAFAAVLRRFVKPALRFISKAISVPANVWIVRKTVRSCEKKETTLLSMAEKGFGFEMH